MRNSILVTGIYQRRDRVIHILLNRVIHTTFTIGRTSSVIIHPQTTTDIHKFHIKSHHMQLHIELRCLTQSSLDTTYFSNLTADMKMNQFQTVLHVFLFQEVKRFQQFTGCQAKLTGVSSAIFPFTTSRRSQLDADTYVRPHIQLLCHFGYQA